MDMDRQTDRMRASNMWKGPNIPKYYLTRKCICFDKTAYISKKKKKCSTDMCYGCMLHRITTFNGMRRPLSSHCFRLS